ncbi:MAG: TRAP transporter large permease [Bacteroidetes bacterium]|nr:TRAP transporter large permease [Bacteroidota bacterium]
MELFLVFLLLIVLILLGSELFMVIGGLSLLLFYLYLDIPMFSVIKTIFDTINKPALLAIPLYIFAGAVMARGEIAKRLIDLALASFGWMKGGLAIAGVLACMFFAAISGSSPVTLVAIGSILYPALLKHNYPDKISVGVLTTAGSLGILIPPSIPMIVFSIATGADVNKLFIAGIIPGIVAGILLIILSLYYGVRHNLDTQPFSRRELFVSLRKSIPALIMPLIVLGGIYSGIYTVTEAASVAAVYAIIIEMFLYRQLKLNELIDMIHESVIILGTIFIIIAMATVFNNFLTLQDVPFMLVEFLEKIINSQTVFILITILILLIVGLFMDIISAILICAPLLLPTARLYEVDMIHLGIIFILALEIGYLTPPVGINLFVSCSLFNKPFSKVIVWTLPFMICLLVTLVAVAFLPDISLFLTNFLE